MPSERLPLLKPAPALMPMSNLPMPYCPKTAPWASRAELPMPSSHTDLAQVGLLAVGAEILRTVVFGVPDAACPNGVAAVFGKYAVQFVLYGENAVERGGKFTQTAIGITADQVALRLGLRLRPIPACAAEGGGNRPGFRFALFLQGGVFIRLRPFFLFLRLHNAGIFPACLPSQFGNAFCLLGGIAPGRIQCVKALRVVFFRLFLGFRRAFARRFRLPGGGEGGVRLLFFVPVV